MTRITNVILLGFQGAPHFRLALFALFFVVYCVTICGNLLIVTLVSSSKTLHTPMYFFLSQLSISDIVLSSDMIPNMLNILLSNSGSMSFSCCISQLYFFTMTEIYECLLLTAMSYDRYVAICSPLHYSAIMTHVLVIKMTLLLLLLNISVSLFDLQLVFNVWFCGPNVINHFYCDMKPLLDLSCSDISMVQLEMTILCFPVLILPFSFIVISYCFIINSILRISTSTGRQKAFSTCSSHLTVVSIFYGTLFFTYSSPEKKFNLSKFVSLLYTVMTPLINPMIYSLRNKDIKIALKKILHSFHTK
ncbi:olfactory receptor 6B1-like [Gastrophryne carolinensis]